MSQLRKLAVIDMMPTKKPEATWDLDEAAETSTMFDGVLDQVSLEVFQPLKGGSWPPGWGTTTNLSHDGYVITGSWLSALDNHPWTEEFHTGILKCVSAGKSVLGICYGSQVLARVFYGDEALVKMASVDSIGTEVPAELGVKVLTVNEEEGESSESLFTGLPRQMTSVVCHFDGIQPSIVPCCVSTSQWGGHVFRLSDHSVVEAALKRAGLTMPSRMPPVHATQFHPEISAGITEELLDYVPRVTAAEASHVVHDEGTGGKPDEELGKVLGGRFVALMAKYMDAA